jgi:hypothetical protein
MDVFPSSDVKKGRHELVLWRPRLEGEPTTPTATLFGPSRKEVSGGVVSTLGLAALMASKG